MPKITLDQILDIKKLNGDVELKPGTFWLVVYPEKINSDNEIDVMAKKSIIAKTDEELDNVLRDAVREKQKFEVYRIKCEGCQVDLSKYFNQ